PHAAMTPGAARGFTLIEVLVALVIVAIALGAGIKAAGALTHTAERLAEVSAAQWCAENLVTELRLTQQFPTSASPTSAASSSAA
ncbi:type II secretion system minor pseudopilin GspI, partial [Klebsiella variicola]|uniref:type II secretion system minor pseudopilin GspI n=1 Tax=Klebsiella variicola TaxID=244366 RepID=UPI0039C2ACEE